ncbi:uncharacterized protein LOC128191322 [Crassostrea angulata]|uniref:uncharacterized protein LOC128191322 n=1 Tax=Magallana angulata TaxID=2784310 RepID=UPI0022B08F4B|nr:uncharacterized protein LOC128191322 [Crassostrea angulata]
MEQCLEGYFGRYCTPCTYPSYGYLCRFTCNCLQHLCHNVHGCPESTMQTTAQTSEQSIQSTISSTTETTKTRRMMAERSSSLLKSTTKMWTAGSFSSTYLALPSPEATPMPGSTGVPPDHASQTSVIIIVGSLVCFFLVLIIGIQLHSKCQKQKSVPERKNGRNNASLYDIADIYDEIEDEHVSIVTKKYEIIANRNEPNYSSPKSGDTDASFAPTCSSYNFYLDVTKDGCPEFPDSLQNSCEPITQPESSTFDDSRQNECEPVHESNSSPAGIYPQSPSDTGYLEPMEFIDTKSGISDTLPGHSLPNSTYLDVVFK